jgi:ankyrin repeat protein
MEALCRHEKGAMYGHVSITAVQTFSHIDKFSEEDDEEYNKDENTWSPLQVASAKGDATTVSQLLSEGTSSNEPPRGWYGKSALQAAAIVGHLRVIQLLLDAGAEVDAPGGNNGRHTALILGAGQ